MVQTRGGKQTGVEAPVVEPAAKPRSTRAAPKTKRQAEPPSPQASEETTTAEVLRADHQAGAAVAPGGNKRKSRDDVTKEQEAVRLAASTPLTEDDGSSGKLTRNLSPSINLEKRIHFPLSSLVSSE